MTCHPNQGQTAHTRSQAVWVFERDGERNTLYKSANFANSLQEGKKKDVPFLPTKSISEQFLKSSEKLHFSPADFHGVSYFLINSAILWQCFGQGIFLARTRAEFEFQILQSTQWRPPFQEVL